MRAPGSYWSDLYVLLADQTKAYYPMVPVLDGTLVTSTYWVIEYPTFALVPEAQNAQKLGSSRQSREHPSA